MSSSNPLAAAAAALKTANEKFPESQAKAAGVTPGHERVQHEYASTPYSQAKKAKDAAASKGDNDGIGSGLRWRAEQSKALDQQ